MNLQAIINDIELLPPEKQEEVADFIEFLKTRLSVKKSRVSITDTTSAMQPDRFFGMWADRESMRDSASWVRQQQEKEWGPRDA